jgi:predicted dehydrogenase
MQAIPRGRSSRRQFLRTMAGTALASPLLIPATALGGQGRPPASERIVMAHIGMGWFGTVDLKLFLQSEAAQNVAVCDVDATKAADAKGLVDAQYGHHDCKIYADFREMLARDDIDAVSIATPDHWHAIPMIEACRRGKDVHIEKPLSLTIREGRAMVEAARRYGRVVQTGSEARSQASCRFACELVRNGRIGQVREVYVGGVGGPSSLEILPAEPVPPQLNWDMWLGPAPWRPYNRGYHPVAWRGYYDFSGGGLTDWGAHHFDLAHWALGMDGTGPVQVIPPDGREHKFLTFVYANGLRMYHVLSGKPDIEMLSSVTIVGTEGRVGLRYGGIEKTDPPSLMKEVIGSNEVRLHQCPPGGHECGDFLTSVRNRSRPGADVEIGHRSISVSHLAHIAYQLRRPLRWDPVTEEFPGDEEANRLCGRAMREPWRL